jgi:hypothetical protein
MIFSRALLWSDGQAITATTASTNIIDLGATGTVYGASAPMVRELGFGTDSEVSVTATQTFNNLTSLTISMQVDDNAAFASPRTVYTSPAYTLAEMATGAKYLLPDQLPAGTNERYVRLMYTVAGTAPTTGRITAGVVAARQTA